MSADAERVPRLSPRSKRSARTRERIIQAATEVFARRGVHGTRVADIAERAGIAYGLVYHHFRNKEEILSAIFAERWAEYVGYLEDLAGQPAPFRERMRRLIHFWVEAYRQDNALMTVMINEITRSYEFLESHDLGTVLVAFDTISALVERARDAGEVRPDVDPQLVAYAILGVAEMVLTGYVMGTLRRDSRDAYGADETQLVALLLDGLDRRG